MAKFVFLYRGGEMPKNEKEEAKVMKAWGDWFTKLGPAIVDAGNPFDASVSVTKSGAKTGTGRKPINGYTIVTAKDITEAKKLSKGCPTLKSEDGIIEIHEAMPM